MKYCEHCGSELTENAAYCQICGEKVGGAEENETEKVEAEIANDNDQQTIGTLIKVFAVVYTVCAGFAIIPLIWMIPMTVAAFKTVDEGKQFSVVFSVLSFFFLSQIAAVLMFFYKRKI